MSFCTHAFRVNKNDRQSLYQLHYCIYVISLLIQASTQLFASRPDLLYSYLTKTFICNFELYLFLGPMEGLVVDEGIMGRLTC